MGRKFVQKKNKFMLAPQTQTLKLVIQEESPPPTPAKYAVLQSKLRGNQRQVRMLEKALASTMVGAAGVGISPMATTSFANANIDAIGSKAQNLARYSQQRSDYDTNLKRTNALSRQLASMETQQNLLQRQAENLKLFARQLRINNANLIRQNPRNAALIRQQHNAQILSLRDQAQQNLDKRNALLAQRTQLTREFQEASAAAAQMQKAAQIAKQKEDQVTRNILQKVQRRTGTRTRRSRSKRL
jgi:hypothetical protein